MALGLTDRHGKTNSYTGNWSLLNSKRMFASEGIKGTRGRKTSDPLQWPVAIVTSMQLRISRRKPCTEVLCCEVLLLKTEVRILSP